VWGWEALFLANGLAILTALSAMLGSRAEQAKRSEQTNASDWSWEAVPYYLVSLWCCSCVLDDFVNWKLHALFWHRRVAGKEDELHGVHPALRKAIAWWRKWLSLPHGGEYALPFVVLLELVEMAVQFGNVFDLLPGDEATLLFWRLLILCSNAVLFGIILLFPEDKIGPTLVAAMDVLFDIAYITLNAFTDQKGSTMSIFLPLILCGDLLHDVCIKLSRRSLTAMIHARTLVERAAKAKSGTQYAHFLRSEVVRLVHFHSVMDDVLQRTTTSKVTGTGSVELQPMVSRRDRYRIRTIIQDGCDCPTHTAFFAIKGLNAYEVGRLIFEPPTHGFTLLEEVGPDHLVVHMPPPKSSSKLLSTRDLVVDWVFGSVPTREVSLWPRRGSVHCPQDGVAETEGDVSSAKCIVIAAASTLHHERPPMPGIVRATLIVGGYLVTNTSEGCSVCWVQVCVAHHPL
jgi:hypothetical protein